MKMPTYYIRPRKEVDFWKKKVGSISWWSDGRLDFEQYKISHSAIVIPHKNGAYDDISSEKSYCRIIPKKYLKDPYCDNR